MKNILVVIGLLAAFATSAIAQDNTERQRPERPDPGTMAKALIKDHDADGNGTLNKDELAKGMEAMRANRPQTQQQRPQAQRPQQGRGQPGQQARGPQGQQSRGSQAQRPQQGRVPQAQQGRGQTQRPEQGDMSAMFHKRMDTNGDGEVSEEELAAGFGKMGRSRGGQQGQPRGQQSKPRGER